MDKKIKNKFIEKIFIFSQVSKIGNIISMMLLLISPFIGIAILFFLFIVNNIVEVIIILFIFFICWIFHFKYRDLEEIYTYDEIINKANKYGFQVTFNYFIKGG